MSDDQQNQGRGSVLESMRTTTAEFAAHRERAAFINGLKILRSIDMHELVGHGLMESGDQRVYREFNQDPIGWVCRLDVANQERFWSLIQSRQTPALRAPGAQTDTARSGAAQSGATPAYPPARNDLPGGFRAVTDPAERRRLVNYYSLDVRPDGPVEIVAGIDAMVAGGVAPCEVLVRAPGQSGYFWFVRDGQPVRDSTLWIDGRPLSVESAMESIAHAYDPANALGDKATTVDPALIEEIKALTAEIVRDFRFNTNGIGTGRTLVFAPMDTQCRTAMLDAWLGAGRSVWTAGDMDPVMERFTALIDRALAKTKSSEDVISSVSISDTGTVTIDARAEGKADHYQRRFIFRVDPDAAPAPVVQPTPEPDPTPSA